MLHYSKMIRSKKTVAVLLALVLVVALALIGAVFATQDQKLVSLAGDGSIGNPFRIRSASDLEEFRDSVNGGMSYAGLVVRLEEDIDLTDVLEHSSNGWEPIGTYLSPFCGTFDGCNKVIKGLWINSISVHDAGLFGVTNNVTIRDLYVETTAVGISINWGNTGILIGYATTSSGNSFLENCHVYGNVSCIDQYFGCGGLLVGATASTGTSDFAISNCSAIGNVETPRAGGLVGEAMGSGIGSLSITDCFSRGSVSGVDVAGGLLGGTNLYAHSINSSYTATLVSSNQYQASIVGFIGDFNEFFGTYSSIYYDINLCMLPTMMGGIAPVGDVIGANTDALKQQSFYYGSDFDFFAIWQIISSENEGYPILQGMRKSYVLDMLNIYTIYDLNLLRDTTNAGMFAYSGAILERDIDLTNYITGLMYGWIPIGSISNNYNSSFNGQGYTISGLWTTAGGMLQGGLFGNVAGGVIENLTVKTAGIGVNSQYFSGILFGRIVASSSDVTISKCYTEGTAKATIAGGGAGVLGGQVNVQNSHSVNISRCGAIGKANGENYAGGLIGSVIASTMCAVNIDNCFVRGEATVVVNYAGGLIGYCDVYTVNSFNIDKCYMAVDVSVVAMCGAAIGGSVGLASPTLSGSFSDSDVCTVGNVHPGVSLRTSVLMKRQDNYDNATAQWNFVADIGIWTIDPQKNEGYPYLQHMSLPDEDSYNINFAFAVDGDIPEPFTTLKSVNGNYPSLPTWNDFSDGLKKDFFEMFGGVGFAGWTATPGGAVFDGNNILSEGDPLAEGNDHILYAVLATPDHFMLEYNKNDGSAAAQSVIVDASIGHVISNPFIFAPMPGYELSWNTLSDGTGTTYANGSTFTDSPGFLYSLYAVWTLESATLTPSSKTYTIDTELPVNYTSSLEVNYGNTYSFTAGYTHVLGIAYSWTFQAKGTVGFVSLPAGVIAVNNTLSGIDIVSESGTYLLTATVTSGGTSIAASTSFEISMSPILLSRPVLNSFTFTYTGEYQDVRLEISGFDSATMSYVGGVFGAKNVNGSYTTIVGLNDKVNYHWSDGSVGDLSLTWRITKAPLTVKADNQSKVYGNANPSLTYSFTGLLGLDEEATAITGAFSISTSAVTGSPVGNYTITLTIGSAEAVNYDITCENGTLEVTANVTIVKPTLSASLTYTAALQDITALIVGFNGSTMEIVAGSVTSAKDVDTYTVLVALKDTTNYAWQDGSTANVTLTWRITKARATALPELPDIPKFKKDAVVGSAELSNNWKWMNEGEMVDKDGHYIYYSTDPNYDYTEIAKSMGYEYDEANNRVVKKIVPEIAEGISKFFLYVICICSGLLLIMFTTIIIVVCKKKKDEKEQKQAS